MTRSSEPSPRRWDHRSSWLLFWLAAMATQAPAQVLDLTLDSRTPLELTSGTDVDQDLMLIGGLYQSPAEIRVFTGPAAGGGPFSEEVAVASGAPYFALSRKIWCRSGSCLFTAVNGTTLQVELFVRGPGGNWLRGPVTPAGVYFNSDMGLNADSITVMTYDAIAFEIEIWRSTNNGPFQQVATHPGAAGAIYGALRASLSTDPASASDYLVLFDDVATLPPTPFRGPHPSYSGEPDHFPAAAPLHTGVPLGGGTGEPVLRLEGRLGNIPSNSIIETVTVPATGDPASRRESITSDLCGHKLFFWIDPFGRLKGSAISPDTGTPGLPVNFGVVPFTSLSEAVIAVAKTSSGDIIVLSPPERAWFLFFDFLGSLSQAAEISEQVYPDLTTPFGGGSHTATEAGGTSIGVAGAGSTRYLLVEIPEDLGVAVIPTLDRWGILALATLLALLGAARFRKRAPGTNTVGR